MLAVINLEPGRYSGPVVISKPLTLIGNDAVIIDNNKPDQSAVSIQAAGVTLKGFTIEHNGSQPAAAVEVMGSDNEVFELNIRTKGAGLLLRDATTSVVRNNSIEWAGASTASSSQKATGSISTIRITAGLKGIRLRACSMESIWRIVGM